jgi:hypothetical protein
MAHKRLVHPRLDKRQSPCLQTFQPFLIHFDAIDRMAELRKAQRRREADYNGTMN